jgi:DNA polymerase-3 subunit gamma/tau
MKREDPFGEQRLRELWDGYLQKLKESKKDVEYATLNRSFEVRDGHTIVLKFNNSVQSLTLEQVQQDLVTYLRRSLMNRSINVTGEVEMAEEKRMVYTNKEKFEYLAEKFPALRELRDKLDLDTDF